MYKRFFIFLLLLFNFIVALSSRVIVMNIFHKTIRNSVKLEHIFEREI